MNPGHPVLRINNYREINCIVLHLALTAWSSELVEVCHSAVAGAGSDVLEDCHSNVLQTIALLHIITVITRIHHTARREMLLIQLHDALV